MIRMRVVMLGARGQSAIALVIVIAVDVVIVVAILSRIAIITTIIVCVRSFGSRREAFAMAVHPTLQARRALVKLLPAIAAVYSVRLLVKIVRRKRQKKKAS